jgi:hypothetical protein
LEFEESNGGGKAQSLRGLIGLIREIPNVDTILLSNEDDTRPGGGESSTGVVGGLGVFRSEDGLFHFLERSLPEAEVEVVDGEEHIIIEGRAFESQARSIITLGIEVSAYKLVFGLVLISGLSRSRGFSLCPVNVDKVTFIRASKESMGGLMGVEENSAEAEVTRTILSSQL